MYALCRQRRHPMTFKAARLDSGEIDRLMPHVQGAVLSLSRAYAVGQGNDAIFLGLGGQPGRNPATSEPPGHFNLLWHDQAVGISGY